MESKNFIYDIINADLAAGRIKSVVTRFPPEPNGYLHIGHAKSVCLNFGIARDYGGKCNLRFDDTNPAKEDDEYIRSITEDIKWLGFSGKILYASDYFEKMCECAVILIEKGLAYVDDTPPEQMRQTRGTLTEGGKESPRRNRPVKENLKLFKDMRDGKFADGEVVLRAKIDMNSPNINMRDPVLYRVLRAEHFRQGDKWKIYPMYDFAHPIEDAVEGITHSICTLEFEAHRPLYDWVLINCGFEPRPRQYEFARLNLTDAVMSKRHLKKLVDDGAVDGWDDPRMPTLAGLRRRGYTPASIREFCARIGVAKANSEVDAANLESCIREELNATAARVMAVLEPLRVKIVNADKAGTPKEIYIERGDFAVSPPPKYHRLTPDGTVRLKDSYIIKCVGFDADGGGVSEVRAEALEGTMSGQDTGGIKCKGVIHWVDVKTCVDIEARLYAPLKKGEELNPDSLTVVAAKGEAALKKYKPGERCQFLRNGYFIRDTKYKDKLVFNRIVGLKDGYNAK